MEVFYYYERRRGSRWGDKFKGKDHEKEMIWERVGREDEAEIMLERGWKEDKDTERERYGESIFSTIHNKNQNNYFICISCC